MPNESGILPVGPGSSSRASADAPGRSSKHEGAPPQHDAPASARPGRGNQINSDRAVKAREALKVVAGQMSSGQYTSREDVVVTDGETSERPSNGRNRPASDVSDSPAIAPTPTPPKAKTTAASEKAAPKSEPTAEEKAAAATKAKALGSAKRALALDGWEPEDINALPEEKLLKMGQHRAKNQADVNREFAKLRSGAPARDAEGKFTETPAAPKAPAGDAQAPAAAAAKEVPATGDDLDALIDAAQDEISEPAAKLLKTIVGKIQAKLQSASGVGESGDMARAVTNELLYSNGYDLVEKEYPGALEPEGVFDEIAENFKALIASGRYGRGQISKTWRDAAFMTLGAPDVVKNAQRDMISRQSAADKGKVDTGKGDKGTATTDGPITNKRDALRLAGQMMAANPNAKREDLTAAIMGRVRGQRVA